MKMCTEILYTQQTTHEIHILLYTNNCTAIPKTCQIRVVKAKLQHFLHNLKFENIHFDLQKQKPAI